MNEKEVTFIKSFIKTNEINCCICHKKLNFQNVAKKDNQIIHPKELHTTCELICQECFDTHPHCDYCGCLTDKLFKIEDSQEQVCSNCIYYYKECKKCHKFYKHNMTRIEFYGDICKNCCLDTNYFKCSNCGAYYLEERYGIDDNCITCANNKIVNCLNYTIKPSPKFLRDIDEVENDLLYMGVELEAGYAKRPSNVINFIDSTANNFFYMKKDASIPAYGCEIVTHPATLYYHLHYNQWDNLFNQMKKYHLNSDNDKCGVHIHMNRNFFNSSQISAIDYFINNCKDFWKKIARRESHYSAYLNKSLYEWGNQISDRHCALNLSNRYTIELRIFKGTDDKDILFNYLKSAYYLANFIRSLEKPKNIMELNNSDIEQMFITFIKEKFNDEIKFY